MGYYDNINEDLLAAIPPDAEMICEVGCGAGAMAARYKRINPDCRYFGIEVTPENARKARESGTFRFTDEMGEWNHAYEGDVERMYSYWINAFYPDLDVLIYGDVLEHLRDPWKHLEHAVKEWLKPGGQVIACVPNSQNWTLAEALLTGEFEYQDAGLLDRTHLRWFTRKTLTRMFEKAGLSVVSVTPRNWSADYDANFKSFLKHADSLAKSIGADDAEFSRDTRPFQWIIKGVKGDPPSRKVAIRAFPSVHCCRRPRLTEPGQFLATIPGVRYGEAEMTIQQDESPVVIVQRDAFRVEQVRKWVHAGVLVIGEWDDWPGLFKANTETDDLPLRAVHAISTTTEAMAETLLRRNPNVGVFPNQLKELPTVAEKPDVARVFCGWQNREEDWKPIIDGFNAVVEDHPKVEVYVIGDREFYHAIQTTNKTFWAFQPYERYMQLLSQCTIAVLPMVDNELSRHKSDIKFIECAAQGVAVLAPIESIYTESVYGQPMRGTLYFAEEFEDVFRQCVEGVECMGHATAARSYVARERMLKDHYRARMSWINALLDTREELTGQLFERCPELR